MKPLTIAVIGILVLVVGGIVVLSYIGVIPDIGGLTTTLNNDNPGGTTKLTFSDLEIVHVIEILRGKDLVDRDVLPFVDALHMELYGVNDQSAFDVYEWYKDSYIDSDWVLQAETVDSHSGWTAYYGLFNKGINGRAITIGDGAAVTAAYGYDTMVLKSYGPVTTYIDFARVL